MIVRALDANGDWTYGSGTNNYKSGQDAVKQDIQTRLNSFLGDCWFDAGAGLDWFNLLGSKQQIALNLAISTVIINTVDVTVLNQLSAIVNPTTRAISIVYTATTAYGVINAVLALLTAPTPSQYLLTESGQIIDTESGIGIII